MAFRGSFDSPSGAFGRRRFLTSALGCGVALTQAARLAAAEFWNAKEPSAWTEEEINTLTTKSPWARAAVVDLKHADDPTEAADASGGGRSGMRIKSETVIVRWESAQPILDALRAPLTADFAGRYVVSVSDLPLPNVRRPGRGEDAAPDDAMERMQNGATLRLKGKDPVEAGIVRRTRIGSILFGFSRDLLRLTPNDREILFTLETDLLTVKARFDGKAMTYHGKLAV